jgi:hypothetical protein
MRTMSSIVVGSFLVLGLNCDKGTNTNTPIKPLEILQPKGGETYTVGQTVEIRWRINDLSKIPSVGVKLSIDNGKLYTPLLLPDRSFPPETTWVSWIIQSTQASAHCIVEVYDYSDESLYDKSGAFTVSN